VVDDEEMVCKVTQAALEADGFKVLTVRGGEEAVAVLRTRGQEIALVLLDLVMPGTGGEEVFRRLRAVCPDLRVLLLSGYDEKEATARFADRGLAGFLQKPWSMAALQAKVRRLLAAAPG
jgi:DNA-binding response OmpR family regulator